ncbi:MAG TPA: PH domain-containing protein [Micromonosporaceae bacterium]|jgi:membrane protein YdbS with pleckstrin-like domain|nr:PH domain-containing protein [Micromonosporaceae bacterium]
MGSPPDQAPGPPESGSPRGQERDTERIPRVPSGPFFGSASVGDYPQAGDYTPPDIGDEELAGLEEIGGIPLGQRRVLPLEDEPSGVVSRYLFPTERYRGEWKRHWIHLVPQLLIGTLATFALGYVSGFLAKHNAQGMTSVGILVWIGIMGWVAWRVADWYFDRFILTNKRVMVVAGIITRRVAMMPLLRVTDMKYEQSPIGRMLNYGTFVLESAGQEQALREVNHLPNPNELYLRVVEEMYEPQAVEARLGRTAEEVKADDGA